MLENFNFDRETILIGHSAGCPLILSILEKINIKIKQAILVAGFVDTLKSDILQTEYNFEKIKNNVIGIVFINSNNDLWSCDDKQGLKMFEKFGGTLILRDGEGHMGSTAKNQPYNEFPLLLKLIS
jgi:predicted alpha/beta hydrolase family esterase